MAVEKSKKSQLAELAAELGENTVVVAAFVGRMSRKLQVADTIIIERLTRLVRELKAERNGDG